MIKQKKRKNFRIVHPKVCGFCHHYHESADGKTWGCYIDTACEINFIKDGNYMLRTQYLRTCSSFESVLDKI